MAKGDFKIAEQIGARAYYGQVALEADASDSGEVTIDFAQPSATRWQSGATFGIDYVLEHIPTRKIFPHGGRIRVTNIEGHEVDTNNVVIAYVAAHALLNALGLDPAKKPDFDGSSGMFLFPK